VVHFFKVQTETSVILSFRISLSSFRNSFM